MVESALTDCLAVAPAQCFRHGARPDAIGEALEDFLHGHDDHMRLARHIALINAPPAHAAVAAGRFRLFAEIGQYGRAKTGGRVAIVDHLVEPAQILPPHKSALLVVERGIVLPMLDEIARGDHVLRRKEQYALGALAVASGTSGFLIVALEILRHPLVQHIGNVRLVDAHAERVRRDDHVHAVECEVILIFAALLIVQPGVIARRPHARGHQRAAGLLDRLAREAIDNAAAALVRSNVIDDPTQPILRLEHVEIEIGPIKAGRHGHGIAQLQKPHDVLAHTRRGCGSERAHRRTRVQRAEKIGDLEIAGPKILPPLGDAVRLVHRHKRNGRALSKRAEFRRAQPLRRDIDDLITPLRRPLQRERNLPRRERRIDIGRWNARLNERRHLILHQRNQRRHDDRQPRRHQRRNLIADRLARARGHHAQRVPPADERGDQLLLTGAERIVSEILPEHCACVHAAHPF